MKCRYCFQNYNQKERDAEAYRRKVLNARASARKAKANGNKGGRKKNVTAEQIEEIKRKYMAKFNRPSKRSLAREYKVSPMTMYKILDGYYDQDKP